VNKRPEDQHQEQRAAQVDRLTNDRNLPVDVGIREIVRTLNTLGIDMTASCEGHLGSDTEAPYIDFRVRGTAFFQEQARQALQGDGQADLCELASQAREQALPVVRSLFDLLARFYETRQISYEHQLVLCLADFGCGTLESQGAKFQTIMPPETAQQRLREYQKEIAAFGAFLQFRHERGRGN
jgi:hypothetical protein